MQGRVASLNASVAAGVVFFEALRQRHDQRNEAGNGIPGHDDSMTAR
jgi:hypothetical protein